MIKTPPQNWVPNLSSRAACHGHLPSSAGSPPTSRFFRLLVDTDGNPHSTNQRPKEWRIRLIFISGWFTSRFRWGTFSFLLITSVISLVAGDLFVDPIQIEWGSRVNTRITGFSTCWFERHDSRQLPFAWFRRDHHRSSSIALPNVILRNFILRFTTCFTYSARIRTTGNSSSAKLRTENRYI